MKNWKQAFISPDAHILDAIRVMDESSTQICLIVDDEQILLGTLTDGDVRRGILRKVDLSAPVRDIMNATPHVISPDKTSEDVIDLMARLQIHQVPVVDSSGRVVGMEILDQLVSASKAKPNWVVLMAGGLGTRLRPLTENLPKPLIPVGQKPVLETILESFIAQNFRRFYLSVNYKAEMVEDYFGDGRKWGVEIRYLHEDERLGTAGALSLIEDKPKDPIFVMNGDLLTRVNFDNMLSFHKDHDSDATMAVREYDFQVPFGVVNMDGSTITSIDEKPVHTFFVNAGIYVIESSVLDTIESGQPLDMPDLFQSLIDDAKQTTVFPVREYWLDIGRLDDLDRAKLEFEDNFQ